MHNSLSSIIHPQEKAFSNLTNFVCLFVCLFVSLFVFLHPILKLMTLHLTLSSCSLLRLEVLRAKSRPKRRGNGWTGERFFLGGNFWLELRKGDIRVGAVLHSLKLTCPLKRDNFNRKCIFQPSIFRGENVSFREGIPCSFDS